MRMTRHHKERHDEVGFTVIEIAIAMMLTAMASTAIMAVLVSQNRTEKRATDFATNQEEVRQALVYLQRDLRSAEPIVGVNSVGDYAFQVDLNVYDSITSTTPTKVSWQLDPATRTLNRWMIDYYGNKTSSYALRGVENAAVGKELFRYFNEKGAEFATSGASAVGVTTGTVAYCTVRVVIDLRAAPNGSPRPVRLTTDVMLRNKLPGANEC